MGRLEAENTKGSREAPLVFPRDNGQGRRPARARRTPPKKTMGEIVIRQLRRGHQKA